MKKGLIVMMIVMMTMALITSCNSEAASTTDSLVEVKIAGGAGSKTLSVTSASNLPDISTLKWYYQATKTSGVFINGQTSDWTAVPGVGTGLEGASLGQFSTGGWNFQFKGVLNNAQAGTNDETIVFTSSVIPKEVSSSTAVNGTVYLTVPLTANASGAKVTFSSLSWNKPASDRLAADSASNFTLTITESDTSNTSTWTGSGYSDGVVTFTLTDGSGSFSYDVAGAHAYTFTVRYSEELVAEYVHNMDVALGADYTVTGSVDVSSNIQYSVVVNDVPVSVNENSATVQGNTSEMTFTVSKTPASVTTGTASETTVVFTNYAADTAKSYYIAQETYGAEAASSFVVTAGETSSNAVAGIDLDLYEFVSGGEDIKQTVSNQTVQVTTTIATGLTSVKVNGAGVGETVDGVTVNSYASETGVLVFTTTHFSQFLVTSSNGAINTTKNIAYDTVISAVSAASNGDTIMLLKDNELSSGEVVINHGITLDGNGYKYSNSRAKVGSDLNKYNDGNKEGRDAAIYVNTSEEVTFKNLTVTTDNIGSIFVGSKTSSTAIAAADPTKADGGTINVVGCVFTAPSTKDRYCFFVNNGVSNLTVNIDSSALTGWAALYSKSKGSTYTIKNSTLSGFNSASEHSSNSFGTIVLEDYTSSATNTTTSNGNTVSVTGSTIYYYSYSSNFQIWLCLQYGAAGNIVTVTNSNILKYGDITPSPLTWEAVQSNDTARESNNVTVGGVSIGWVDNNHY